MVLIGKLYCCLPGPHGYGDFSNGEIEVLKRSVWTIAFCFRSGIAGGAFRDFRFEVL